MNIDRRKITSVEKNVKSLSKNIRLKIDVGRFIKKTNRGRLRPVTLEVKMDRPVSPPDISKFGLIIYVIEKAVIMLQKITEINFLPNVLEKIQSFRLTLCKFTLSPQLL